MSALNWPDGTTRSMGNAFSVLYAPRINTPPADDKIDLRNKRQREYARRTRAKPAEKMLLDMRGRSTVGLGARAANSITIGKTDKAKTARLIGKPNHARSQ